MSKESILDYQVEMIDYNSDGLSKPNTAPNYQFTLWELNEKIQEMIGNSPNKIRWIGNSQASYLNSFVYVLLTVSLKNQDLVIKLKHHLYELSRKYLQKSHQKLLVQFLCLIQYTKDKYNFLRKYPQIVKMMVEILKFYENEVLEKQNFNLINYSIESPLRQKRKESFRIFCSKFNFISVSHPNQYTYVFRNQDQPLYLLIEKDCFFIVEKVKDSNVTDYHHIDQNYQCQKDKYIKNSTPKFNFGSNSTLNKNKRKPHIIHQIMNSQNFIDLNTNSSQDCSLQDIQKTLKMIDEETLPHKRLNYDQIETATHLEGDLKYKQRKQHKYYQQSHPQLFESKERQHQSGQKPIAKSKKYPQQKDSLKQNGAHHNKQDPIIKKLKESQQKRKQLWLKLEQQYYEKKKQICQRLKKTGKHKNKKRISTVKLSKSKYEPSHQQKYRKKSFNSLSCFSIKDDSDFYQSEYDAKSFTKSHQQKIGGKQRDNEKHNNLNLFAKKSNQANSSFVKKGKNNLKESPQFLKEMIKKKKNSNQNITIQENRLSVIQEENMLKFMNWERKQKNKLCSPKYTSNTSSNRETLDANMFVKFHYVNKNQNISTPTNYSQKMKYYGSPIRV